MAQITLNSSGVASSGSLLLQTNGTTTQATVDTSGNLGLGVTPSAWASSYKMVQASTAASFGGNNSNITIVGSNYYNDGVSKYIGTGAAALYLQDAGVHKWLYAGSGSAGGTISFTQAMTLDASGNLGVGTTSPAGAIDIQGTQTFSLLATRFGSSYNTLLRRANGTQSAPTIIGNGETIHAITFAGYDGTSAYQNAASIRAAIDGSTISSSSMPGRLMFYTTPSGSTTVAEVARIDSSGNLLVAGTNVDPAGGNVVGTAIGAAGYISISRNGTTGYFNRISTDGSFIDFKKNGTTVGSVSVSGSTTAYNTSSDYRLKENIAPMTGALSVVQALKPCTYTWKIDGAAGQGFIAHELQAVVPECVTGAKDAVDEDNNPVYQGIDTSFLVATLTAAIQELNAKFEAYKAAHP